MTVVGVSLSNPIYMGMLIIALAIAFLGGFQVYKGLFTSDCGDPLYQRTNFLTGVLVLLAMGSLYHIRFSYFEYETGRYKTSIVIGLVALTTVTAALSAISFFIRREACSGAFLNIFSLSIGLIIFGASIYICRDKIAEGKKSKENAMIEPKQN